jgi:uncharacterized protein (TIGR02270 family)
MDQPGPRVMLDILEEHFDELDFLWEQRERMLFAPDRYLNDLAQLEERAEAHLDGLRIGCEHSVQIARPHLAGKEVGAATAAAFVFLAMDTPALAIDLMNALPDASDEARDGVRIALRHSDVRPVQDRLYELSVGSDIHLRALAADVLAFHRLRPPPEVERLLSDDDSAVARLGYRAAGRFGKLAERDLQRSLASDDPTLRRIGLEEAARTGIPELLRACRAAASGPRCIAEAVAFLGVIGEPDDIGTLKAALMRAESANAALAGMGSLGSPAAVPLILDAMEVPELASAAADAFTHVTGVHDITLTRAPAVSPTEDAEDEIDDLPSPDPQRARAVWDGLKARFASSPRWEAGRDVSSMDLGTALATLPLRCRREHFLRLSAREPEATRNIELERRVGK